MKSTEDWGRKNLIVQKYLKDGRMVGLMVLVTEMKLVSSITGLRSIRAFPNIMLFVILHLHLSTSMLILHKANWHNCKGVTDPKVHLK